jgi:methylmalonyl-CoA mutase C-terminal domain/subunit
VAARLGGRGREELHVTDTGRHIRVLIAKPGLDGHDRGAKFIARAFKEAGMEVIYTGIRQTPEAIVNAAIQEDVDAVGLSILSGAHRELFPAIVRGLREQGASDILIFAGGVIPEEDLAFCAELGIRGVFTPGTPVDEAIRFVREHVRD